MALATSVLFNIIVIIIMILNWFKVPNMILEHYKSHLKEINQQKENEFRQKIQQQQHDFEKNYKRHWQRTIKNLSKRQIF